MQSAASTPLVAIAAGGTGGHLFPGLAVAQALTDRGARVLLLVSPKEVDQQAARTAPGLEWRTLPAVALQKGRAGAFVGALFSSWRTASKWFRARRPRAVLGMGGFTCVATVLAAKGVRAATFLHEANAIPGRAIRWLAPWVDEVCVNFPAAADRLRNPSVRQVGMPVRAQFRPLEPEACRLALGLEPDRPVLLVMGGSQGAAGVNELMLRALPRLAERARELQLLHLTGAGDFEKVRTAYFVQQRRAVVRPFLAEMELALGAATIAVSRAGASSLAELAAMRVPAILIPYPAAVDNHQLYNARALAESGAARLLEQWQATPDLLARLIFELVERPDGREAMSSALARWHDPAAAARVAERVLERIDLSADKEASRVTSEPTNRTPGDTQRKAQTEEAWR
ncbi:MAG: undecaprenyldiphospho-muramoylpentapeptide beta-N-acetylglucosaminyltransferase [Verrucomicrobia bacterium]|nr:undecaprenyldiphospho-muramoylpentapeptide beta-N-acetylglucosaminyltransferase [Verrucomicrobiota bacterium]